MKNIYVEFNKLKKINRKQQKMMNFYKESEERDKTIHK